MTTSIVIANGARAVETRLLDELARAAAVTEIRPSTLAKPLRVIVPSTSLRDHVSAALTTRAGALLGIRVQTLAGTAHEILDRAGESRRAGDAVFPVLVRQVAREERALRAALDSLQDGYAIVVASVADLLDAGLEPQQVPSLEALVAQREGGARACAVLRVAARTLAKLREAGLERDSDRLARATRIVERRGPECLPSRALWVHGYAEATGRASALLEALVHALDGRVLLDHPPDPLQPDREEPAVGFTARLRQRLARAAEIEPVPGAAASSALHTVRGPGAQAEVRAVARRIRALLDRDVRPERIALVSRALDGYALPLRTHFGRLGIPFSGLDRPGPPAPEGRRLRALVELLRRGEQTPVDRWLDALGWLPELGSRGTREPRRNALRADLSLGLHALGAGRLRDVAELRLELRLRDQDSMPLPVRRGLSGGESEDDMPRAVYRRISRAVLESAVARAQRLCERLARAHRERAADEHLRNLRAILREDLGWSARVPGHEELTRALSELAVQLPERFNLDHADVVLLLEQALAGRGASAIGGEGAGVQLLDVTQARARTFEHLFLIGMNRDVFPRSIAEDPLLPDELRIPLAEALPEIPIKRRGHEEEAYLYAQLLAASPNVTLSWQTMDDEGVARTPSSFVVRQQLARLELQTEEALPLWSPAREPELRPAHEHAVLAGLYGSGERADEALEIGLSAAPRAGSVAAVLARARAAVRREYDPPFARRAELGPYFGFVGATREPSDLRRGRIFVTALESYGRCPWQSLLRRFLRLDATPDALDALPALDPLILGSTVHATLEAIVLRAGAPADRLLAELTSSPPLPVPWPDSADLDEILDESARAALLERGVELPGLAGALRSRARPYVERARELVWNAAAGTPSIIAAEVQGELSLPDPGGKTRTVYFRADLVEKTKGELRLSDYKTGRPISEAAREATRRQKLLKAVRKASHLQALAYRLGPGGDTEGRYLFLRPGLEQEHAVVSAGADAGDLESAFHETTRAIFAGLDRGAFFPRLLEADRDVEPRTCEYCEVAEACLRGDSSASQRLRLWAERRAAAPGDAGEDEAAALRVFNLGVETDA